MPAKAFSLIESMMVVFLLTLILAFVLPSLNKSLKKRSLHAVTHRLLGILNYAKKIALLETRFIVVCGSSDALHCDGLWSQGVIVFEQTTGKLYLHETWHIDDLSIKWHGFSGKNRLTFTNAWWSATSNGRFDISITSMPVLPIKKIIINRIGRIRIAM